MATFVRDKVQAWRPVNLGMKTIRQVADWRAIQMRDLEPASVDSCCHFVSYYEYVSHNRDQAEVKAVRSFLCHCFHSEMVKASELIGGAVDFAA